MNNSETTQNHNYHIEGTRPDILILIKVLIGLLFIYPVAHYSIFVKNAEIATDLVPAITPNPLKINSTNIVKVVIQPSCPISHMKVILRDLCDEVVFNGTKCTPEDFNNLEKHKIPVKKHSRDPRADLVGYLVALFVVVSLFATFLELYKAKQEIPAKIKARQIPRKFSLADLTVLKHQRKEKMRRDSIMEDSLLQPEPNKKPALLQRSGSVPAEITNRNLLTDSPKHDRKNSKLSLDKKSYSDAKSGYRTPPISENPNPADVTRRSSIDIDAFESHRRYSRLVHRH